MNGILSEWINVTSGMPKGSSSLLYCVNDIRATVGSHCKLFTDEVKLTKQISNIKGFEEIQEDSYELCRLTVKW